MTLEELIAKGLTEDQAKDVMALHGKSTQAKRKEVEDLTAEVTSLKETADATAKSIEDLTKDAKVSKELQEKLDTMTKEHNEALEAQKARADKIEFDSLLSAGLAEHKVLSEKAIAGYLDNEKLSVVEVDGKRVLSGLTEQITPLKESDGFLFGAGKPSKPNYNPAGGAGGGGTPDAVSMQDAIAGALAGQLDSGK